MGQIGPIVQAMGHNGPNFSRGPSPLISELGKCVRHLRQRVGYTVKILASETGLPGEYIEAVETGRVELSVRALVTICEALGLSGAILFRNRKPPP
jgi:transcriptional regulator with XRE-family HTH domain